MAPEVGIAHIAKGGSLCLVHYDHLSWDLGGLALAIIAEKRPELISTAVTPFVDAIARGIANYDRNFTGPAEGFVRVIIAHAPLVWREVLDRVDITVAEESLAKCITLDEDHRRTASAIIESAIALVEPIGHMGRRLRKRFPKTSATPSSTPRFNKRRRPSRKKRKT